jgi:hypothetical protein
VSAAELVRRAAGGRIVWTPELEDALNAERQAGKTLDVLAAEFGIAKSVIKRHTLPLPAGTRRSGLPRPQQEPRVVAPPIPAHLGRPMLPCGCWRGHPCERAQALKLAYEAETFGTREWATKREQWVRHVSGEEARSGSGE